MARYRIDGMASKVVVCARSRIHDTRATWNRVSGEIEADPELLADARARVAVDMTSFDAGDWLRNRKLKGDLDVVHHPSASFELARLLEIERLPDGSFAAAAEGTLRWRGREVAVRAAGRARFAADGLSATGSFDALDEVPVTARGMVVLRRVAE